MINYLQVENLTKSYGDLVLFDNISFTIGEGQRIFFYKRTNRPITFSEGKFDHKGKLTLPVPDSESAI